MASWFVGPRSVTGVRALSEAGGFEGWLGELCTGAPLLGHPAARACHAWFRPGGRMVSVLRGLPHEGAERDRLQPPHCEPVMPTVPAKAPRLTQPSPARRALPFWVSFVEQRKDVIQKDSFVVLAAAAGLLVPRSRPLEKGSLR